MEEVKSLQILTVKKISEIIIELDWCQSFIPPISIESEMWWICSMRKLPKSLKCLIAEDSTNNYYMSQKKIL